jgi:hypothetical protein
MIVKIQQMEQWTGVISERNSVYLEVPDTVDIDRIAMNDPKVFYYGENSGLLIDKLISLGAKRVSCPIKVITV